ncbi:hypothetical protein ACFWEV_34900 [Streptomyces bacillaris]|uniref:hypothetical protein n=1 Tax=Streptomyces bacillaris TaxID=68179 RepID=UPI00364F2A74
MSDDRPVLLPSSCEWSEEARLVGGALRTVQAAAPATGDEARYVLSSLTWQVAAELVEKCPTIDHHHSNIRIMLVPEHDLRALWACYEALVSAHEEDVEATELANLLSPFLRAYDDTDLEGLVACLGRVLSVLSLGIDAAGTLATHLSLKQHDAPEAVDAVNEILTAWRKAGVAP